MWLQSSNNDRQVWHCEVAIDWRGGRAKTQHHHIYRSFPPHSAHRFCWHFFLWVWYYFIQKCIITNRLDTTTANHTHLSNHVLILLLTNGWFKNCVTQIIWLRIKLAPSITIFTGVLHPNQQTDSTDIFPYKCDITSFRNALLSTFAMNTSANHTHLCKSSLILLLTKGWFGKLC